MNIGGYTLAVEEGAEFAWRGCISSRGVLSLWTWLLNLGRVLFRGGYTVEMDIFALEEELV